MIVSFVKNLIKQAKPLEQAKHSFKAFHNPGADYVNLLRTPDLTAKLYLFDPKRVAYVNDGCYGPGVVVNPHDHRYDFDTLVLAGGVVNVEYTRVSAQTFGARRWYEHRFDTPLAGGPGVLSCAGETHLFGNPVKLLRPGEGYSFGVRRIHSIYVPEDRPTVLFLLQYRARVCGPTSLFTQTERPPSLDNLYLPMAVGEYQAACDTALECLGRLPN